MISVNIWELCLFMTRMLEKIRQFTVLPELPGRQNRRALQNSRIVSLGIFPEYQMK